MSIESLAEAIATAEGVLCLNTPQEGMRWYTTSWRKWLGAQPACADVLKVIEADSKQPEWAFEIDREDVHNLAGAGDPLTTFIASQVWGHGDSGYGAYRVATALGLTDKGRLSTTFEQSLDKLTKAYEVCQDDGAVVAYRYLVNDGKMPMLGTAFLTKYLYFIPQTSLQKALILDALVKEAAAKHVSDRLRQKVDGYGRQTATYKNYLDVVDEVVALLSSEYGLPCRPDDVEVALFNLGRRARTVES